MQKFYTYLTDKFAAEEKAGRITKAELARRTGKDAASISRLLGGPTNMTIGTLTDLLIGIAGEEPVPASAKVSDRKAKNYRPDLDFKNDLSEPHPVDNRGNDLNPKTRKEPQLAGTA
jgi:transcriptional regulator with XRE-family HTH domain